MAPEISRLADVRRSKGVTLEQIAAATKIRVYYLRAIEEGRLEKLPGGIYTANYIRQYARALECDAEPIMPEAVRAPAFEDSWKQAVGSWAAVRTG
ncbi:MAG: helix-turn-helix domain-containing protein [Bryobacteraceae bacterium]